MPITVDGPKRVQLVAAANEADGDRFEFRGCDESDAASAWSTYAEVRIVRERSREEFLCEPLDLLKAQIVNDIPVREFYAQCRRRGLDYSADFQLITQLLKQDSQALARIQLSERAATMSGDRTLDTCTLDACFQVLMSLLPAAEDSSKTWLPVGLQRLLDEAAECFVLEQVEPLRIAQGGVRSLWLGGAELRRSRHVGALIIGANHAACGGDDHADDEEFVAH